MPPAERIEIARRTEAAAMAYDTRIQNSRGGDFDTATSHKIMMNSRGFLGGVPAQLLRLLVSPSPRTKREACSATTGFQMHARSQNSEDPKRSGASQHAAPSNASAARQVKTQKAPVVFSAEMATVDHRQHLRRRERRRDLSPRLLLQRHARRTGRGRNITVIDDGTMVFREENGDAIGGFGTRPFDGEGLPTRRTVLVERGILKNYVMNTYTARKLKMKSTGNAARGLAGNPGIGAGNFYLEAGTLTPAQIIGDIKNGLYVTETMGHGVNLGDGRLLRGPSGMWIENGELAYPVEEITIAGNLKDMYRKHCRHRQRPRLPRSQRRAHHSHRRHDHRRIVEQFHKSSRCTTNIRHQAVCHSERSEEPRISLCSRRCWKRLQSPQWQRAFISITP